jgi:hypothetical protein
MPHQNSYSDVGFTPIAGMMRAMVYKEHILRKVSYKLFGGVCNTANKFDQLIMIDLDGVAKTKIEHCVGKLLPTSQVHENSWYCQD